MGTERATERFFATYRQANPPKGASLDGETRANFDGRRLWRFTRHV